MNPLKRIFIIESVFEDKDLHDAGELMEKQLEPICQALGIVLKRYVFYSLKKCLSVFDQISESSSSDGSTAIHLVCHGANDAFLKGLVYKIEPSFVLQALKFHFNTEIMTHSWSALRNQLAKINAKTNNNLFLSMCVCYGANIFTDCDDAFAKYTIASDDILYADEIKQTFIDIYMQLLTSTDKEKIIESVQDSNANMSQSRFSLYEGITKLI